MTNFKIYDYPAEEHYDGEYTVEAEGMAVPLHFARVSAVPFNRRWPGHQRDISQSKIDPFVSFAADKSVTMTVKPKFEYEKFTVRPKRADIECSDAGGVITLNIKKPQYFVIEFDNGNVLHVLEDKIKEYKAQGDVIYFGKGIHDAGVIELKSNQTLFIDEGAVVYACVHARDAENIKIIGTGILDNSKNKEVILHEVKTGGGFFDVQNAERQDTIRFEYCNNIVIDGITIRDSLEYNISPILCRDISVSNVKIIGCWRYNSDGIDPHGCVNVHIDNCFIRTFDDSICVKSFSEEYADEREHNGQTYYVTDNFLAENCVIWNDWGKCLEVGVDTQSDEIKNIIFRNCDIIHAAAVALDVANMDYGEQKNILFEDIYIEADKIHQPPVTQETDEMEFPYNPKSDFLPLAMQCTIENHNEYSRGKAERGQLHDVTFKNIFISAKRMPPCKFLGYDSEHMVKNITFENIVVNGEKLTSVEMLNAQINEYTENLVVR